MIIAADVQADYTRLPQKLSTEQLNTLQEFLKKEIPWFSFTTGSFTLMNGNRLLVKLTQDPELSEFCRIKTLDVITNKNMNKIFNIEDAEYYFTAAHNGSCSESLIDYVWTRNIKMPDFLVSLALANYKEILSQAKIYTKVKSELEFKLTRMEFIEIGENKRVLLELDFESKSSELAFLTFVDVLNGDLILISASAGDQI